MTGESAQTSSQGFEGYEARLKRVGITTSERRSRGGLIEFYMIITAFWAVQWEMFVEIAPNKAIVGHIYQLFMQRKGTLWQRLLSARVVGFRNGLDDIVLLS